MDNTDYCAACEALTSTDDLYEVVIAWAGTDDTDWSEVCESCYEMRDGEVLTLQP